MPGEHRVCAVAAAVGGPPDRLAQRVDDALLARVAVGVGLAEVLAVARAELCLLRLEVRLEARVEEEVHLAHREHAVAIHEAPERQLRQLELLRRGRRVGDVRALQANGAHRTRPPVSVDVHSARPDDRLFVDLKVPPLPSRCPRALCIELTKQ